MRRIEFTPDRADPIARFESVAASSVPLGHGEGEAHVYCVRFEAGGRIGRHEAGFDQLFLVVQGEGWAEGGDGERVTLSAGQGARFEKGEPHAKGSDVGMTAIMVQVSALDRD